jgi:hypothetical protein
VYLKEEDAPGGIQKGAILEFGEKPKLALEATYICIEQPGYTGGHVDDPAFMEALSKFKQLIHLGVWRKFFNLLGPPFLGLAGLHSEIFQTKADVIIFDKAEPDVVSSFVSLPPNIEKFIDRISFNKENKYYKIAREKDGEAVIDYIKNILNLPAKLISAPPEIKEAVAVRSAAEWAFEASISENETIAFLQTCIGLEAILGDDSDRDSLTETLADRCAYLIADSIQARKRIRKNFKELYRLRSKLVHGRAVRLNGDEKRYLGWAKDVLNTVIGHEMNHLKLGKL